MGVLRFTTLFAFGLLASCTLIISPEEGQSCTSDDQCAATSTLAGFPASCLKYFCNEGTCLEYEDGDEVCDGWDNDCDGIIDEPSDVGDEPWRTASVVAEGVPSRVPISYGASPWVLNASWVEPGTAPGTGRQAAITREEQTTTPQPLNYLATNPGTGVPNDPPELQAGCVAAGPDCVMQAVASAPTHQQRRLQLLATVTTRQCAGGRLLIGHSPPETSTVTGVPVVLRDPEEFNAVSNSLTGIDTGGGNCTGASRPDCDGTGAGCGAGRPEISVIASEIPTRVEERRVAQGLVAWVGDTIERPHCGGDVAPIEAVVAHLQRRVDPEEVFWVTASGDAVPERLGESAGGGAPALTAWMDRGWVVAFGNAAGNVQVLWIPSQPAPPMGLSPLPVPDLEGVTTLGELPANGADHVVVAIGSDRGVGLEVGFAWLEGCGSGAQRVVFRRALATASGANLASIEALGDSVELEASTSILGAPSLAYSAANFLAVGTMRAGELVAEDNAGGWIAMWATGVDANNDGRPNDGRIAGARIAELDGSALEVARVVSDRGDAPYVGPTGRFVFRGAGTLLSGEVTMCSP